MRQRGDVAERVDVGEAQIVDERRVVDMGVEVDDVQRRLVLVASHDRVGDRVVAAEHHRQRAFGEDRLGEVGRIVERALHVGGPDVDVADIGDGPVRHLVREVGASGLRVVEPGIGGGEAQRVLANRARPHARAGEERRAFVEGDPVNRDVGVERIEVGFDRRTQERGDADERAVEPDSGTSAARCHGGLSGFAGGILPDSDAWPFRRNGFYENRLSRPVWDRAGLARAPDGRTASGRSRVRYALSGSGKQSPSTQRRSLLSSRMSGPTMQTAAPRADRGSTPRNAATAPNRFWTVSTRTIGDSPAGP